MAQHGYLREYDEGWDRGDDRERGWQDQDRERGSREVERYDNRPWDDDARRDRGMDQFMLGRGSDRREASSRDFGDRARSWFRDDDHQFRGTHRNHWDSGNRGETGGYGPEHGYGGFHGDYGRPQRNQGGFGGRSNWDRSPRNFSSHQDDHYRSWRDHQMNALDRDYEEYCREREQQFHHDFDTWRRNRQNSGSSQTQPQQRSQNASDEVMELDNPADRTNEPQSDPSPTGNATLGTNNSENSGLGGRR